MSEERDELLQRYLDGAMEPAERAAFEREVATSDESLNELYDELAVRAAFADRTDHVVVRRAPAPRRRWIPASIAAAAVILLAVVLQWPHDREPVLRSGAPAAPRAVEPVGPVENTPARFIWTSGFEASTYRFELFDADGTAILSETTADTFLVLPVDAVVSRGVWRATALDDLGLGGTSTGRVEFWTID